MSTSQLGFVHKFMPGETGGHGPTLLLLHGTGGDENDMLPIGRALAPDANLLSPRGQVLENGIPRFFRRLAEGVFDLEDLERRTNELAGFVNAASKKYGFDLDRVVAMGYSNGANIAGSVLLLHPRVLEAAVLFRPMVPLAPKEKPGLNGKQVYVSAGIGDPTMQRGETERLVDLLKGLGAKVVLKWVRGGHALTSEELPGVREWLRQSSL